MRYITEETFMCNPRRFINLAAYRDNFTTVMHDDGSGTVIISETHWAMLLQALKLCTEHPEWTKTS